MANYVANNSGAVGTDTNWTPTGVPGVGDHCDINGKAMTTAGSWSVASLTDLSIGGGTLTLATGTLTCPYVDEVEIIVPGGVTATIAFGTSGVDPGCVYSGSGKAIYCEGTVTNVTGDVTNSGSGYGAYIYGTWTDFSGKLYNSGVGYGAYNDGGVLIDFSGHLYNSGSGYGASNYSDGTWTDFSGDLYNSGSGIGVDAFSSPGPGTGWLDFTGNLWLGSLAGNGRTGYPILFSGNIKIRPQADLSAANIKSGKTILTVAGTLTSTDILGAGML